MFLYHPEIENPVKNTAQTENVHKIAMKALLIVYLIDSRVIIENINIIKKKPHQNCWMTNHIQFLVNTSPWQCHKKSSKAFHVPDKPLLSC